MTAPELATALRQALLALGVLFVIVNLKEGAQLLNWWRMRHQAVTTWLPPKPPYFAINVAIGVLLAVLLFVTAYVEISIQQRGAGAIPSMFGISMMFLYYGYLLPLASRVRRGLYRDGIWTDTGFLPYTHIGGMTWKSDHTLVLASREKAVARRLRVPGVHIGEVRHILRDKMAEHAIEFEVGPGLHLGSRDPRESV
ncbi:MAG TPA: hypothetical protein VEA16_13455 [Vicinamibacterales bacterium]|nr:hypothetical protein [Vicinamibacterales bacterium]